MGITTNMEDHTQEVIRTKNQAVEKALEMMGLRCEGYAKANAPVDTGRLRNSITHDVRSLEEAVYIGTNVEYAPYQEYGTYKMNAQPFLRPAVNEHLEEYKNIANQCLNEIK